MIQLDSEWAFTKLKKKASKKEKDSEWDIQWWFFNWCGVIVSHKNVFIADNKTSGQNMAHEWFRGFYH